MRSSRLANTSTYNYTADVYAAQQYDGAKDVSWLRPKSSALTVLTSWRATTMQPCLTTLPLTVRPDAPFGHSSVYSTVLLVTAAAVTMAMN
eukprot:6205-Heterococcus_DN1.PRE.1